MWRLLTDENINGDIIRGLLRRRPELELVRVQDVGLNSTDDPMILEWAAAHNFILVTHDQATMPDFAYQRVADAQAMPGIFVINDRVSLRQAIDEILLLDEYSDQDEWNNMIVYLPL